MNNAESIEQWIRAFRQSGFTEMFGIDETTGSIEPMTAGQVVYRENINLLLRRDLKTSND